MSTQTPAAAASRRDNLHVSDIAAILGKSVRRTALDVYRAKLGLELDITTPDIQRGRKFEDIAADCWMERTGLECVAEDHPIVHPRLPFLLGHIDRRVTSDGNQLELKCPRVARFWRIKADGLEIDYILQGQGYAMIEKKTLVHWGLFCADNMEVLPFQIAAEPSLWPTIESEMDRFWNEHVLPGVPPPAANYFDQEKLVIDKIKGEVELRDDVEFVEAARLLREAALIVDDGEGLFEEQKERILGMVEKKIGKYADSAGHIRLSYYECGGKSSLKTDELKRARPLQLDKVVAWLQSKTGDRVSSSVVDELVAECELKLDDFTKTGEPYRVFRPTYPKERS